MTSTRPYASQLGSPGGDQRARALRGNAVRPRGRRRVRLRAARSAHRARRVVQKCKGRGHCPRPSRTSLARLAARHAVDVHRPGEACSRGLSDRPRRVARRVTGGVRAVARRHRTLTEKPPPRATWLAGQFTVNCFAPEATPPATVMIDEPLRPASPSAPADPGEPCVVLRDQPGPCHPSRLRHPCGALGHPSRLGHPWGLPRPVGLRDPAGPGPPLAP